MKASTKRMISIVASIFLLIVSVFIYNSLIKPAYGEIFELRNRTATLEQTYNNYESLNKKFQEIFAQYQNLGDLEKQLSMILPSKLDTAYAAGQISGIASKNKINFLSLTARQLAIKPGSGPVKGIGVLRMEAKLSGAYENFKMFSKDMETNIMISDLVNLRIEKAKGVGSEPLYAITIDTYYQAE